MLQSSNHLLNKFVARRRHSPTLVPPCHVNDTIDQAVLELLYLGILGGHPIVRRADVEILRLVSGGSPSREGADFRPVEQGQVRRAGLRGSALGRSSLSSDVGFR